MNTRSLFRWATWMAFVTPAVAVPAAPGVEAVDYHRITLYHSPEPLGYTCWTGAWLMPGGDVMVSFTQATIPKGTRAKAPADLLKTLKWTAEYDMTGLDLRNVHLRSSDGGKTWWQASADAFQSPMNGITGDCETALPDGTVVRGVWGQYLAYNPELPKTGYLQRSRDGTKTWGAPELFMDPTKGTTWPKRLRVLHDGRLLLVGGWERVPGTGSEARSGDPRRLQPLLMVSADAGRTWSDPIEILPPQFRTTPWGGEEYDVAELGNGDLLCVFRRPDPSNPGHEARWQGLLKKQGATWVPGTVGPAPFPHSGHPELLATREGVVLHLATTGVHWTDDAGKTWHPLAVPGTAYYPRSVQVADGRILVFAHVGTDDPYGKVDQSIVMDSFRLKTR